MRRRAVFSGLLVCWILTLALGTKATPQIRTWRLVAHVDGITPQLVNAFPPGTPIEVIFSFDPGTPDADASATVGEYYDSTVIPGASLLRVRAGTYAATASSIRLSIRNNVLQNGQPSDSFSLGTETQNAFTLTGPALPSIGTPRSLSFAISGGDVPDASQFQSDALPANPPHFDLSQPNSQSLGLAFNLTGGGVASLDGKIDRIEPVVAYEYTAADFSSVLSTPTTLGALAPGTVAVSGQVGPCSDLDDAFTFDVPAGYFLTGIRITYDSDAAGDLTPIELVRGTTYSTDSVAIAPVSASLATVPHSAGHDEGFDLLAYSGAGPQPPGSYTVRAGPECDATARYSIELVVGVVTVANPGQVTVDPHGYVGDWAVGGTTHRGSATVMLPLGFSVVTIAGHSTFAISVDASGFVSVPIAGFAIGGLGTLTFATQDVAVDPRAYTGDWSVDNITGTQQGPGTVTFVGGLHYIVTPGASQANFDIFVQSNGIVQVTNSISATGGVRTLTFNTSTVSVDPGAYQGPWGVEHGVSDVQGPGVLTLVSGAWSLMRVNGTGSFFIMVDGAGQVSVQNGVSALGGQWSLAFNTDAVAIDPATFAGLWNVERLTSIQSGPGTATVVRGADFQVNVASGAFGGFHASIGANGQATIANGLSAFGGTRTITFRTVNVRVDPGLDAAGWFIHNTTSVATTAQRVILVPGVSFELDSLRAASQLLAIGDPCTVTPGQFALAGFSYQVSCVTDTTPPVLSLPSPISTPAADSSGAAVTFSASANDDVDGAVPVQCSPASGAMFPIGTTTVTCTASDAAGNTASGSFASTVLKLVPTLQWATPLDISAGTALGGSQLNATASVAGTFNYTPTAGTVLTSGSHQLTVSFTPNDGAHYAGTSATVTIVVVNPAPIAQNGAASTNEDASTFGVLSASDPNHDALTFAIVANGAKGTATITNPATGAFTYTPTANANGPDTFTFKVNDGTSDSNIATITVSITAVNDLPVVAPAAIITNEDTVYSGQLVATDADSDPLTYTRLAGGSKGRLTITNVATGQFTYTPYPNANGPDVVTFTVSDGHASSTGSVTINITPVNDAPTAHWQTIAVLANRPEAITLAGSDPENTTLTFAVSSPPTHGALSGTVPSLVYTPAADYTGPDSFTFTVGDGQASSVSATVSLTVATTRWTPVGPSAGDVLAIAVDPNLPSVILAATSHGLFRSTNGASTWYPTPLRGGIVALAIDPNHSNTIFASLNGAAVRSTDGGATWSSPGSLLSVKSFAIDPTSSNIVYAGTQNGVFKSSDGGLNWSPSSSGLSGQVPALVIDPSASSVLYGGTPIGVFKSTNGGASWVQLSNGTANKSINAIAIDPSDPSVVYAGVSSGGVLRSGDGGASWTSVTNGLGTATVTGLAIDPSAPSVLFAATNSGVFKSNNSGANWAATSAPTVITYCLAIDPVSPGTVYAGAVTRIPVSKTADAGLTWAPRSTGLFAANARSIMRTAGSAPLVYTGVDVAGVFGSPDAGSTWSGSVGGPILTYSIVQDPATPTTLYAGGSSSIFRSTDGGATWLPRGSGLPVRDVRSVVIDPSAPSTLYVAIDGQGIWKTTNGAATWFPVSTGLGSLNVTALAIDPTVPQVLYAGTSDSGLFKTTDSAAHWTASSFGLAGTGIGALVIDPVASATIYVGLSNGPGVFKSSNAGASWTQRSAGIPSGVPIISLAIHSRFSSLIWAGTGNARGIYVSADGGLSWTLLPGSGNWMANALAPDPDNTSALLAATSAGVLSFETAEASEVSTASGANVAIAPSVVLPAGGTSSVGITFSSVTTAGTTDVVSTNGGLLPPDGFTFGNSPIIYDVQTTAAFTGPVQICFSWQEGQLSNESTARLFHYEGGAWHDVTTSVDTQANRICGSVTTLSPFAIGEVTYQFGGFLAPLLPDGSASIQQSNGGRTIPVKFQLLWKGQLTGAAVATIAVNKILDAATGTVDTTNLTQASGQSADSGNQFRYDASSQQYVFNLSTKGWSAPGTYRIYVTLSDGTTYTVDFSLR